MKKLGFIVLLILFFVYHPWFSFSQTLSSGDWPYLFKETIQNFSFFPDPSFLWLGPYYQITSKLLVQYLHIPWEIYERVFWFWMFLVISFLSSWYFAKVIFKKSKFNFFTILIFMSNTYILMIVGGGQMGVALSYSLAPAVLGSFIDLTDFSNLKENIKYVKFGSLLGFQVMFDPRIAYVTILAMAVYILLLLYLSNNIKQLLYKIFSNLAFSGIIVVLINSPWIIARIISKTNNFFTDFSSGTVGSIQYFSFASFAQTLSLLHPNWPENIFGKTYFLKPEFLILPILSFAALLFLEREKEFKKEILFFVILGILGVFLSKGTKEPMGYIYQFLFSYVPGFFFFRDPTKFYVLTVISYSVLIPYSLEKISSLSFHKKIIVPLLFIVLWLFLIRQAVIGGLSGTFRPHAIPNDYVKLKNFLNNQKRFFATLWLPTRSNFSFYSNIHPMLDASTLFGSINSSTVFSYLANNSAKSTLKKYEVSYIIIPYDWEGKIFLNDRSYSEKEYQKTVQEVRKVPYLMLLTNFGKIIVFEVQL